MNCHICNQNTTLIYQTKVLNKYDVSYFKCSSCNFIQTEHPYWLKEAYENVITSLDIGLVSRNLYLLENIPPVIDSCFPKAKTMLDYGGGYGMFVRMMRDKGYQFFRQDIYCDNLFSKHFDISENKDTKIDIVTAFEVFEHLEHPLAEIEKMLSYAENIIFSTALTPRDIEEFKNWWYITPQTGQHISFYSVESLEFIAKKYNLHFYTNGHNLHFFSKNKIDSNRIQELFHPRKSILERVIAKLKGKTELKPSLLQSDYDLILKKINK
jgi:hypothetical protein